jgi:hypothetical protein
MLSDEHLRQAMGHTGDPNVQTPWMDRLASEGVTLRPRLGELSQLHAIAWYDLHGAARPGRRCAGLFRCIETDITEHGDTTAQSGAAIGA